MQFLKMKNFLELAYGTSLVASFAALVVSLATLSLLLFRVLAISNWIHVVICTGIFLAPVGMWLGFYRIKITHKKETLGPKNSVIVTGLALTVYNLLYGVFAGWVNLNNQVKGKLLFVYNTHYTESNALYIGVLQLATWAMLATEARYRYDEMSFALLMSISMFCFGATIVMGIIYRFQPTEAFNPTN